MSAQSIIYPDAVTLIQATPENPVKISVGVDTLRYGTDSNNLSSTLASGQNLYLTSPRYIKTDADAAVLVESFDPWTVLELAGYAETVEGDATFSGTSTFSGATTFTVSPIVPEPSAAAHPVRDDDTRFYAVETNEQTANYTLVLADAGKVIEVDNASDRTVTVPPDSSVAFETGTIIEISREGAGAVTILEGSGVTVTSPGDLVAIAAQNDSVRLRKRDTDDWRLSGALA